MSPARPCSRAAASNRPAFSSAATSTAFSCGSPAGSPSTRVRRSLSAGDAGGSATGPSNCSTPDASRPCHVPAGSAPFAEMTGVSYHVQLDGCAAPKLSCPCDGGAAYVPGAPCKGRNAHSPVRPVLGPRSGLIRRRAVGLIGVSIAILRRGRGIGLRRPAILWQISIGRIGARYGPRLFAPLPYTP